MWNKPTKKQLAMMPRLYETDETSLEDKVIHQHYFFGGSDWYMAEYCPDNKLFFGYAILNGDYDNSEWGYVGFDELDGIKIRGFEVDRDLHWTPKKFADIDSIIMNSLKKRGK